MESAGPLLRSIDVRNMIPPQRLLCGANSDDERNQEARLKQENGRGVP